MPSRSRPLLMLVSGAAALSLVSACAGASALPPEVSRVRVAKPSPLKKECTDSLCKGERSGAGFEIRLPTKEKWNGTLVLWSHGYRNPVAMPSNPIDPASPATQPSRKAESAPTDEVAQRLLEEGYALAGSSFKTNGWDVAEGVSADEDLYSYFDATFGKPDRVYVWGASLGGLITETVAEKAHPWVSGSAPACGVLGGSNLNFDLAMDVAYAVKTLFDPSLKLTGYTSSDEAIASWEHASRALAAAAKKATPEVIAKLFVLKAISGAPAKTMDQDGHDATSIGTAIVEATVTALAFGTVGRYDIEQRVGGNPSQNIEADYAGRVSSADRATVNAAAPGQLAKVLTALENGKRVRADQAARAKFAQLGNPTGRLTVPTFTMHTEDDPLVIAANENVFARRVDHAKGGSKLTGFMTSPPVTYTQAPYGAGHCNFTTDELVAQINVLDNWVRTGEYPADGVIAKALDVGSQASGARNTYADIAAGTATTGYNPSIIPPAWPAPEAAIMP